MKLFKWLILPLVAVCLLTVGCQPAKPVEKPLPPPLKEQSFVIYRADASGQGHLIVEKHVIKDNGRPVFENALQALVEGRPQSTKTENLFPAGTKVLRLSVKDGLATVDFSKEIKNLGEGSYSEIMLAASLANTLTEFPEISKVQLLVEGRKVVTLNGHLDFSDPFVRDESMIMKSKTGEK